MHPNHKARVLNRPKIYHLDLDGHQAVYAVTASPEAVDVSGPNGSFLAIANTGSHLPQLPLTVGFVNGRQLHVRFAPVPMIGTPEAKKRRNIATKLSSRK